MVVTEFDALQIAVDAAREARDAAQTAANIAANPPVNFLEWVKVLPSALFFIFLLVLLAQNFRRLGSLIDHVESLDAFGVKINRQALANLEAASNEGILNIYSTIPSEVKRIQIKEDDAIRVLKRAQKNREILRDRRILWIDDVAENNKREAEFFAQLELQIEFCQTNDEALRRLSSDLLRFHVVVSDIARDNQDSTGLDFLTEVERRGLEVPIIFYITHFDRSQGVPKGAFGITNRPDELLHLVLDALERLRPLR